jgi:hypothetical protein
VVCCCLFNLRSRLVAILVARVAILEAVALPVFVIDTIVVASIVVVVAIHTAFLHLWLKLLLPYFSSSGK